MEKQVSAAAKLNAMCACQEAMCWIGSRSIEKAWSECERSDWMLWLLRILALNDPRCRLAAADFAERAWHHIQDEGVKLAAAWAIDAARRFARGETDREETDAARHATAATTAAAAYAATTAAAAYAATYAAAAAGERRAQADILRGYFTAKEIGQLFRSYK